VLNSEHHAILNELEQEQRQIESNAAIDEKITRLTAKNPESDPAPEMHIENRRLFDVAFGRRKLEEWEQNHLHACKVCQGVLYVFVHQPPGALFEDPGKRGNVA